MPEKIQKGMSYTGISQLLSMAFNFAVSVILAKALGDMAFGLYSIFQTGLDTLSNMLDLGGNSTLTKFIADADADENPQKAYTALISVLIWHGVLILAFEIILAVFARQIMGLWFDNDKVIYSLIAISVPVAVICGDIIGALYGLRELKYVALRMVTQHGLVFLGSLVLIFWLGFGVRIAVLIIAAVWVILGLGLFRVILKLIRNGRLSPNSNLIIAQTMQYSLPIGGVYMVETAIRYAPVLLVKAFNQGNPNINQTVSFLALAVLFAGIVESVIRFLVRSGYGYLSRWHHLKLNHLFVGYTLSVVILAFAIYVLAGVAIKIGLPFFLSTVYGDEYLGVQAYIYLALAASMFRSMTVVFRISLYVMGKTIRVLYASLVEIVLYVLSVMIMAYAVPTPNWGILFLQAGVLSSMVRVILLTIFSVNTLRSLESKPLPLLVSEAKIVVKQKIAILFQRLRH